MEPIYFATSLPPIDRQIINACSSPALSATREVRPDLFHGKEGGV